MTTVSSDLEVTEDFFQTKSSTLCFRDLKPLYRTSEENFITAIHYFDDPSYTMYWESYNRARSRVPSCRLESCRFFWS